MFEDLVGCFPASNNTEKEVASMLQGGDVPKGFLQ